MKLGDVLNGYEITTAPTNAGGGMSQWSFARKDGGEYFVKMFLAPKYPTDASPGSEASKHRKREMCLAFERRHLEIARRLDPSRPGGGNLVLARDFFRVDTTYVKVMDKVEATGLPPIGELSSKQIQVVLRSLAFSLRMLHEQQVVHADIKPDNVLLERAGTGLLVSKVIDFDEAYVVGEPPRPEHIVGDPSYYSPELLRYIKQDERLPADALSTASDMFSLGLFLHVFLTGRLPDFDRAQVSYPAEALLARNPLDVSSAPTALQPMLARMLALIPSRRPTIDEFIDFLASVDGEALVPAPGSYGAAPAAATGVRSPAPRNLAPPPATRPAGAPPVGAPGAPPSPGGRPGPGRVAPARPATPARREPDPTTGGGLRSTMGRRSRPSAEDPPT